MSVTLRRVLASLFLVALVACAARPTRVSTKTASPRTSPASIGETFTLESKILGERRVINVYVPPDYASAQDVRYPVLFMPDGGLKEDFPHVAGSADVSIKNGVIRPLIVVGIENIERRHDVTSPTVDPEEQKAAPRAGGSTKFRQFLRDELKPYIAAHYRITSESALIGESLAGLFVLETFLVEPTLFDSYIAVDPSLQWNEGALLRSVNEYLAAWPGGPKQLYITTSGLAMMLDNAARFANALRIFALPDLTWIYDPLPDEQHSTIFGVAAVRGIRAVFAN